MATPFTFSQVDKHLADRKALYIRNNSPRPTKILVINYPSAEGPKSFSIPRTTIPFNICDYLDPDSLRSSDSFRKMLNKQIIEVVDTDLAERQLADPAMRRAFLLAEEEANNTYKARAEEAQKARGSGSAQREETHRSQANGMKNIIASMDPTLAKALNFVGTDGQKPLPRLAGAVSERSPRLVALEARVKKGPAS